MGFIQNDVLKEGDPNRLSNGMDYLGNICGVTDFVTATGANTKDLGKAFYLPSGAPVCVATCPEIDESKFYCKYDVQATLDTLDSTWYYMTGMKHVSTFGCAPYVASQDWWNYCVPNAAIDALASAASEAANAYRMDFCEDNPELVEPDLNCPNVLDGTDTITAEYLNPTTEDGFFDQANADMMTARVYIVGFGCGAALVLGFLYLYVIRIPGVLSLVCWGLIAAIEVLFLGMGYFAYDTSEKWKLPEDQHSEEEATIMLYVGYFFGGCGAIWFVIICCLRKRIILAIGIVKEAAKAVAAMPVITMYPVFQVLGVVIFLVPWSIYMMYLASSGEVVVECAELSADQMATSGYITSTDDATADSPGECNGIMYKSFSYSAEMKYAGLYMMFSWFWTSQFVIAMGQLVVAMSVSTWYFTRDKSTIGNKTFFATMKKAMWYHMGSAAFGSLIIAIIKTIRVVVAYLQNKAKKSGNAAAKAVLCAIQCCMWCLEKCMKFLNKNAYIQIAIFGYSFCKAAKKAFFLILRNILRISAVAIVSEFVLIIGKLFITVTATVAGYKYLEMNLIDQLNGLWCPTLLIILFAYVTADMFNEVFGMAIWTILQCFVADEELFENPADRFCEGDLASVVGKTQKAALEAGIGDTGKKKEGMDAVVPVGGSESSDQMP